MRDEIHNVRDLSFSQWHRSLNDDYRMIDIDYAPICNICQGFVAFYETAIDFGQSKQNYASRVHQEHANRGLKIPVYMVYYTRNLDHKCDHNYVKGEHDNCDYVTRFRVRRLLPERGDELIMSPNAFKVFEKRLRSNHLTSNHPDLVGAKEIIIPELAELAVP